MRASYRGSLGRDGEPVGRSVHKIILPKSTATLEDLKNIETTSQRRSDRPSELPLSEIHCALQAFQIRKDRVNEPVIDRDQALRLISALVTGEKPLRPIKVTAIGDKFYVVDGHHRYTAYLSVGWSSGVPVECFEGNVSKAELEAGRDNHEDKLPVSLESKLEYAWTLVRREEHSLSEIHEASGRALRTVSNMRVKRRELVEAGEDPWSYTWRGALAGSKKCDSFEMDSFIEKKSTEMKHRICQDTSVKLLKCPEVLAAAIEKISLELPRLLVEQWGDIACDYASLREEEEGILDI